MRAKTVLTILFALSLVVAAFIVLRAIPQKPEEAAAVTSQILVSLIQLDPGTLLRDQDVTWGTVNRRPAPGEFVQPSPSSAAGSPDLDEDAKTAFLRAAMHSAITGAAARATIPQGAPIRRSEIVKPGDRDFLQVVLSPGARAIAIPVTTGGASTGLLYPGDRVDVVLTQQFNDTPINRRSVSETVVENLRVLAIDAVDAKSPTGGTTFGRTVTLEVTPMQAESINVATELGKLSLTLRGADGVKGSIAGAKPGPGVATDNVRPAWAGDVSPALGGLMPRDKVVPAAAEPVVVLHGTRP